MLEASSKSLPQIITICMCPDCQHLVDEGADKLGSITQAMLTLLSGAALPWGEHEVSLGAALDRSHHSSSAATFPQAFFSLEAGWKASRAFPIADCPGRTQPEPPTFVCLKHSMVL